MHLFSPDLLHHLAHDYGLWVLFGVVLLECMGVPMPGETALVSAALRSGIRAVISREASPEEIESAIQAANAGLVVIEAGSLTALLRELRPASEALSEPLSDRELEVLNLIAEGQSNKLIAHSLGISEHTVKTHVASIFAKLGAGSRTEAVSQAIRRGLVML